MAGGLFTGIYSGMIIACADPTIPPGWLLCDGASQSRVSYPDLFSAIGHTYNGGVDPGNGQFKLPGLANRFVRGAGSVDVGTYDGNSTHEHTFAPSINASNVSGGGHIHVPASAYNHAPSGDHSHIANFSEPSAAGGVNSAIQSAITGQTLSDTARHHTHPTPSSVGTNNSGSHGHAGIVGGNMTLVVNGTEQGQHVHNVVAVNRPTITLIAFSNDPKHHIVQYLIKT